MSVPVSATLSTIFVKYYTAVKVAAINHYNLRIAT
ncbi:MAG: hypothetical protein ACJAUH_000547 [Saprospiraceae bacterium]